MIRENAGPQAGGEAKEEIEAAEKWPRPMGVSKFRDQPASGLDALEDERELLRFETIEEEVRGGEIVLFFKSKFARIGEMERGRWHARVRQFDHLFTEIDGVDAGLGIERGE